ncbi:MAG: acyl carrier protein [Rhodospirillaceae bacterium]|nr:acyl carrier protein [Rhodospirillales bacterium]
MSIEKFIEDLRASIDTADDAWLQKLTPDTQYQDLPEWDSLAFLCVLALLDSSYGVEAKAETVRKCKTIADLYALTAKA